jgi:hypothetical protein
MRVPGLDPGIDPRASRHWKEVAGSSPAMTAFV